MDLTLVLLSVIGSLLALLATLVGWFGNRMSTRLDELQELVWHMAEDTKDSNNARDQRVTRNEAHIERINDELFGRRAARATGASH